MEIPELRKFYKHFKGEVFIILGNAIDFETGENTVVMSNIKTAIVITRKVSDFFDIHPKLNIPRFLKIELNN